MHSDLCEYNLALFSRCTAICVATCGMILWGGGGQSSNWGSFIQPVSFTESLAYCGLRTTFLKTH